MKQARTFPELTAKGILLVIAVVSLAVVLRYTYTDVYRGANDFYIPWRAAQSLLWEGHNPYGPAVTAEIQRTLFGETLGPGSHQFNFAYPLTVVPILLPYTLFNFEWAQPLWQATLQFILIGGFILWYRLITPARVRGTRRYMLGMAGLVLWGITVYPTVRGFYLGQIALLVFGAIVMGLWALQNHHDITAGAMLAITTIKPQLSFLFVPIILILAWRDGRHRVIASFTGVLVSLGAFSLMLMPRWPLAFVQRLAEYQRYTSLGAATDSPSPLGYVAASIQLAGNFIAISVGALLVLILVSALWKHRDTPDWLHIGSAILFVGAWIAPRAATTDQALLLLPLLYILRRRSWLTICIVAIVLWIGDWYLFVETVQNQQEHPILRMPVPTLVLVLWLWNMMEAYLRESADSTRSFLPALTPE